MLRATLKSRLSLVSEGNLFPRATRFDAASLPRRRRRRLRRFPFPSPPPPPTPLVSSVPPFVASSGRCSLLVPRIVTRFSSLRRVTSSYVLRNLAERFLFSRATSITVEGPSREEGAEETGRHECFASEVKGASNVSDRDTRTVACVRLSLIGCRGFSSTNRNLLSSDILQSRVWRV